MNKLAQQALFEKVAASLDIPNSAYEKAEERYKSLYDWLTSDSARCRDFSPDVYSQGSFRLGTVVRPVEESMEYDLDVGLRLKDGLTKENVTQKDLKDLIGADLEDYRVSKGIKAPLDEKTRCWRLSYADELRFHLDGVPSIPEENDTRQKLEEAMVKHGSARSLAADVAKWAGAITDNRDSNYSTITPLWKVSNSQGYAIWFQSRMQLATLLMEKRAAAASAASIENLPAREWKSPLQETVRILKRHRDVMFRDNPDSAPISVIITTLAATAYSGQETVLDALEHVLRKMEACLNKSVPRVPNPVNPVEDFADKWSDSEYKHDELEKNFHLWVDQANADFDLIVGSNDPDAISFQLWKKFGVRISADELRRSLVLAPGPVPAAPRIVTLTEAPAKPWSDGCNQ